MPDARRPYVVRYRDHDPTCPTFAALVYAYDRDDARERFHDANDADDGWRVLSVRRAAPHRRPTNRRGAQQPRP